MVGWSVGLFWQAGRAYAFARLKRLARSEANNVAERKDRRQRGKEKKWSTSRNHNALGGI